VEKELNGSAPLAAQAQTALVRNVIQQPPGLKLVYTTSQGAFVGELEVLATSGEALAAIANDFQAFAAQQTGGVQIAGRLPPGALLKPS
jgi:hypothetical protein